MKLNDREILKRINFSDFIVLSSFIDKEAKSIDFSLNGASLIVGSDRLELGAGHLKLEKYNNIFISSYNAQEKSEKILSEDNYEELREICEIDVSPDEVIIKGFAKTTFNWIEFHIRGGVVRGIFTTKK